MESRANHILIGSFVLLGIIGIFAFVIWKAKIEVASSTELLRYLFFEVSQRIAFGW